MKTTSEVKIIALGNYYGGRIGYASGEGKRLVRHGKFSPHPRGGVRHLLLAQSREYFMHPSEL